MPAHHAGLLSALMVSGACSGLVGWRTTMCRDGIHRLPIAHVEPITGGESRRIGAME